MRLWSPVAQPWRHAEGVLFPALTIVALASVGAVRWRPTVKPDAGASANRSRSIAAFAVAIPWLAHDAALLFDHSVRLPGLKVTSLSRVLIVSAIITVWWLVASPRARRGLRAWLQTPAAFFGVVTVFAIAMSFGPDVHARGRTLVVHEGFFKADFGRRVTDWARSHGAHETAAFGRDRVFSLRPPP